MPIATEGPNDPPLDWLHRLEALPPAEQAAAEGAWGFTRRELAITQRVLHQLRQNPRAFLEDDILRATQLWRWTSWPREQRSGGAAVFKAVRRARRAEKRKRARDEDRCKLARTEMHGRRTEAAARFLAHCDPIDAQLIEQIAGSSEGSDHSAHEDPPPPPGSSGSPGALHRARSCHTCRMPYRDLHHFYHRLCRDCGDFNFAKRSLTRDLRGKHVLLTGARIKIGFQVALKLLRCGAILWATTRFPADALQRFLNEDDHAEWIDRLHLHRLDLRDLWAVGQFCSYLSGKVPCLFAAVHNAAQTIARPPEYHSALEAKELASCATPLPHIEPDWHAWVTGSQGDAAQLSGVTGAPRITAPPVADPSHGGALALAAGALRAPGPPVTADMHDTAQEATDQRATTSWSLKLGDVTCEEAAGVMAANALAPLEMNARLKPLLLRRPPEAPHERHFIVNVSAMEGQFSRNKSVHHPHTNMAKAALNMMTRTSGADYAGDGIMMTSVDTGWVTDMAPHPVRKSNAERGLHCPLDEVDAAARVLDPILTDSDQHSVFLKDFRVTDW
eukprot:TRINITY_DN7435_c0_g1_i1.p1 TRINITY_DN7435_c0_g1~~TRINITY_DN7435_c0_g1_i1.p1  ORF type:complete len:560 (+),score=129.32 TRINITY_DN7435_c0_g1_i1:98-1777(+)